MPGIRSARLIWVACAALVALGLSPSSAGATSRIKDLANIEGVRQNQLIGYGLVVGLNGTGDTLNNIPFTKQSLQAMLERMGVNIRGATIRTGNVAAVMVTGNLPAFGTQGTRMDVTGPRWGAAKTLMGGPLLFTPSLGPPGSAPTAMSMRWRRARSRSAVLPPKGKRPVSPAACPPSAASPTAPSSNA